MKLKPGDKLENIILPNIDGINFDINEIKGKKTLLTFYRFASCPFCNLRINELISKNNELDDNFKIIAVFDSSLKKLNYLKKHEAPFTILADEKRIYFKKYDIERSIAKFIKGSILKAPKIFKAMMKGFIPLEFKASLLTIPVDILIKEDGTIHKVHYGIDTADHLTFKQIKDFSKR